MAAWHARLQDDLASASMAWPCESLEDFGLEEVEAEHKGALRAACGSPVRKPKRPKKAAASPSEAGEGEG